MPAVYDNQGVRFLYPENWSLDEQDDLAEGGTVSVISPGGAFWSIMKHSPGANLKALAGAIVESLREEYAELDVEPIRERVGGHDLVGFDLNFFCMELTNTAIVRGVDAKDGSFLIVYQAEDREFAEIEGVFRAMTISLLQRPGL